MYTPAQLNVGVSIDYEHQKVHEGEYFVTYDKSNAIGTSNVNYMIDVATAIHLRGVKIDITSGTLEIALFEDATFSDNGTELNTVNLNRFSSKTNTATYYKNPSITDYGTEIGRFPVLGEKKVAALGKESFPEYILRTGKKYLVVIEPQTTSGNTFIKFLNYINGDD